MILFLFASPFYVHGQSIEWEQNYGGSDDDYAKSVRQNADGEYIVAGSSASSDGDVSGNKGARDYWIMKLDGFLQWDRNYGGSGGDNVHSFQQTDDGGFIVAGSSQSPDGDVSGNKGGVGKGDCWIVKLDGSGNLQWERNYGGSGDDQAISVQQTDDGGYIVAGHSTSSDGDVSGNNGNYDYWIVKLDGSGNLHWERNYGGSGRDRLGSVQQTDDGGYILAGRFESTEGDVSAGNGDGDFWVLKLDGSGNLQWERNYGGSGHDQAYSVQQTDDGGYILAGNSTSSDGDVSGNNGIFDYWIVKVNGSGNLQWERNYGGSGRDQAYSVQQTDDGGYISVGLSNSNDGDVSGNNGRTDFWVVKLDGSGNLQWEENYGGSDPDRAYSVQQTDDGGYIVGGSSESSDGDVSGNKGDADYWVVKLDLKGKLYEEKE